MSKRFLMILLASLVVFGAGCGDDASDKADTSKLVDCKAKGNVAGVITNDLFSAVQDEVSEHKDGFCLESEHCVKVMGESDDYACSAVEAGKLSCDGKTVDALTDAKNCGKCGNVCASNKCEAGVCAADTCKLDATICAENKKDLMKCDGSKFVLEKTCENGCEVDHCVAGEPKCEEGASECKDNKTLSVCKDGDWVDETCNFKCIQDENEVSMCVERQCEGEAKQCSTDKKGIQTCDDGLWTTVECGTNMVCGSGVECECAEGTELCSDGVCADLKNDPKHCGSCKNDYSSQYGCKEGASCVLSGKFEPPVQHGPKTCCDENAKMYAYLIERKECQDGDKYTANSGYGYSFFYCMTPEMVAAVENSDKCLVEKDYVGPLSDKEACGATAAKCNDSQTCHLGVCCYDNNYKQKSHEMLKEKCCSGMLYLFTASGGREAGCTNDPEYCEKSYGGETGCLGHSCTCEIVK